MQMATGSAMQVGWVGGNFNYYTINQTINIPAPPPSPAKPEARQAATVQEVLHALDLLEAFDKRRVVLAWMNNTFGTRRVLDLDARQLLRALNYAQGVLTKERERAQAAEQAAAINASRLRKRS